MLHYMPVLYFTDSANPGLLYTSREIFSSRSCCDSNWAPDSPVS